MTGRPEQVPYTPKEICGRGIKNKENDCKRIDVVNQDFINETQPAVKNLDG